MLSGSRYVHIFHDPGLSHLTLKQLQKPLDVTEPELRFEESWLNVLAVLVQSAFYKMPIENENFEHDRPTPNVSEDRDRAENRWARVMDEFVVQSSNYDTPRSLLHAYRYGLILQKAGMVPVGLKTHISYAGIRERLKFLVYESHKGILNYTYLAAIFLSVPYAGIHMSAWNATFPTSFELKAWRACCVFLASGPVTTLILFFFLAALGMNERSLIAYVILSIHIFLYCWAKVFIVVESFISLRLVPIGVFWTPMWLQLIPHV